MTLIQSLSIEWLTTGDYNGFFILLTLAFLLNYNLLFAYTGLWMAWLSAAMTTVFIRVKSSTTKKICYLTYLFVTVTLIHEFPFASSRKSRQVFIIILYNNIIRLFDIFLFRLVIWLLFGFFLWLHFGFFLWLLFGFFLWLLLGFVCCLPL